MQAFYYARFMTPEERKENQKVLLEEIGKHYTKQGVQPTTARVLALFMVMEKEIFTFDEIIEELSISKGAASNALRHLEAMKILDYLTLPGDRKRYFHLKRLNRFALMDDMIEKLIISKNILESILELKINKDSENALYFKSILEIIDYSIEKVKHHKNEFQKKYK